MNLPTVTYEQFLEFEPCWAREETGRRKLRYYKDKFGGKATALDILKLKRVPAEYRLWAVLREEFIPANMLHEFACRVAEKALALIENPDPRSIAAIGDKRKWLRGEITNDELAAAWSAAQGAVWAAAQDRVRTAALAAAQTAARGAARTAAWSAAQDAALAAACGAARSAAWNDQVTMLIDMMEAI